MKNNNNNNNNNDLISRQMAIDVCHFNYDNILDFHSDGKTVASTFEDILNSLPSTQPDLTDEDRRLIKKLRSYHNGSYARVLDKLTAMASSAQTECKQGKWIRNDNGTYSCSLCQSWIPEEQYYYARFCLHCGAKMENENGEWIMF